MHQFIRSCFMKMLQTNAISDKTNMSKGLVSRTQIPFYVFLALCKRKQLCKFMFATLAEKAGLFMFATLAEKAGLFMFATLAEKAGLFMFATLAEKAGLFMFATLAEKAGLKCDQS